MRSPLGLAVQTYAIFWMGSDIRLVNQPIRTFSTLAAAGAALNVINGDSLSEVGRERLRMRDVLPLYHGIHCERFAVNERTFSKDRATVLCTRWFEPIYDNLTIVRAFAAVQEWAPGIRMVFAASGVRLPRPRICGERFARPACRSALASLAVWDDPSFLGN